MTPEEQPNQIQVEQYIEPQLSTGNAAVHEHQPFEQRLHEALDDQNLQNALGRFAPGWRVSRAAMFQTEEDDYGSDYTFQHMRRQLRMAKDHAIDNQEELIAQFKVQAKAAGAIIY